MLTLVKQSDKRTFSSLNNQQIVYETDFRTFWLFEY